MRFAPLVALAFALLSPLALPAPVATAQTLVDPAVEDLRYRATDALLAGDLATAMTLAQALVARDPGDPVGRGILARIALTLGNPGEARDQAVALWRTNPDPAVRYDAARLVAFSWVDLGWPSFGQYWLRRALTVAPDDESAARTIADFRALRDANPLTVELNFALSPSRNVTGGTDVDIITINDDPLVIDLWGEEIPLSPSPIDRAYSGVAYAPSLSASYRLREDDESRTSAWGMLQYRGVILSESARRALDGQTYNGAQIRERHFSFGQALIGLEHQLRFAASDLTFSAHGGRSWSRGAADRHIGSLGATYTFYTGEVAATSVGFTRDWRLDSQEMDPDEIRDTLRLGHVEILPDATRLRYSMAVTEARSASTQSAFDRLSIEFSAKPADPLPGIGMEARASYTWTNYPDYSFFEPVAGGRTDETVTLGLDLQLRRFDYAGFSPVVSLEARRTLSNVNQFEMDELVFDIGFESSF